MKAAELARKYRQPTINGSPVAAVSQSNCAASRAMTARHGSVSIAITLTEQPMRFNLAANVRDELLGIVRTQPPQHRAPMNGGTN